MLEKMSEMIAEQLNCDAAGITAETSFKDDLGADSLDLFELCLLYTSGSTDGKDIYYQGKTEKNLPVSVDIKYYMDGTEVSPEALAGKTGHLKMEVTYAKDVYKRQQQMQTRFTL